MTLQDEDGTGPGTSVSESEPASGDKVLLWGPWLFGLTLVAVVGFFWWLTIAAHG